MSGCAKTPSHVAALPWFKNLQNVEYEEVEVEPMSDKLEDFEKERVSIQNNIRMRKQTSEALKNGYYPIVLGGDRSISLGAIQAAKKHAKDTQVLWMDSRIDIVMKEGQK
jgi:arginase family enzyme